LFKQSTGLSLLDVPHRVIVLNHAPFVQTLIRSPAIPLTVANDFTGVGDDFSFASTLIAAVVTEY
jgi:hypothetical protein